MHDLQGLENLTKLNRVYVNNNFVSSIAPLADKPELEELYINDNNISSLLPLENNKKLKILQASNNLLQNIDGLSSLERLEKVYIFNNDLVSLEGVQNLKRLSVFVYSKNSELLPEAEKSKVRELFAKKKKLRYSVIVFSNSCSYFDFFCCIFREIEFQEESSQSQTERVVAFAETISYEDCGIFLITMYGCINGGTISAFSGEDCLMWSWITVLLCLSPSLLICGKY